VAEIFEQDIPDACVSGCPLLGLNVLAEISAASSQDLAIAREAGLSDNGIALLLHGYNRFRWMTEDIKSGIPDSPDLAGPWKPKRGSIPEDN
jgi:hypothetical protein